MQNQRERLRRYLDVSRLTLEPIAGEDGWYFASFTSPDGSMTHVLLMTDNKGRVYLPEPVSDESLPEQIDAYTSEYRLTVFIEPKSAFEIGRSVDPISGAWSVNVSKQSRRYKITIFATDVSMAYFLLKLLKLGVYQDFITKRRREHRDYLKRKSAHQPAKQTTGRQRSRYRRPNAAELQEILEREIAD